MTIQLSNDFYLKAQVEIKIYISKRYGIENWAINQSSFNFVCKNGCKKSPSSANNYINPKIVYFIQFSTINTKKDNFTKPQKTQTLANE